MFSSQAVAALALLGLAKSHSPPGYYFPFSANTTASYGKTIGSSCACAALQYQYPDRVLVKNSTDYTEEATHYYDARQDLEPKCIFLPSCAEQVVMAVKTLKTCKSQFAVRGAGHMSYVGAANTQGGVLVALTGMKDFAFNEADNTAEAGPGHTWFDMASNLEPYGRIVIGGRLKTIGISGLTLGGGLHYFLNKYGYAMDNVAGYDVVTGNGELLRANTTQNSDMFWALKGGGANFGIVTRFIFNTYDVPRVTSTYQIFNESAVPAFIKAVVDKTNHPLNLVNPVGAGAVMLIQVNATTKVVSPEIFSLQEGVVELPDQFANFTAIPGTVKRFNITTAAAWSSQFDTPYQTQRQEFGMHSVLSSDTDAIMAMYEMYKSAVNELEDVEGVYPTFVLQEMPKSGAAVSANNGIGNTWSIDPTKSKIWWEISTQWRNPEDDLKVLSWSHNLTETMHAMNMAKGLGDDFIYQNDASEYQKPYDTIPPGNMVKLRQIRAKYDPDLVFRKLSDGGFKFD